MTTKLEEPLLLFTVGHSNYPLETFVELVRKHNIEVIADVRSNPYSRYATHFTGQLLKKSLPGFGLKYVFLGAEIGGKPKDEEFLDEEGYADYEKLAASEKFLTGMYRLQNGLEKFRVAIMCGEEDPSGCHRHLLIGKAAQERGIAVKHIRKTGELQDYEELARTVYPENFATQLNLFGSAED